MDINTCSLIPQVRSDRLDAEDQVALNHQLCTLLRLEAARSGRPWIQFSHLAELYRLHYGKELMQQIRRAGYLDSWLFWRDHRQVFSTYATPEPGNPYVAVFEMVNPTQDFRRDCRPKASQRDRPRTYHRRRPSTQPTRKL